MVRPSRPVSPSPRAVLVALVLASVALLVGAAPAGAQGKPAAPPSEVRVGPGSSAAPGARKALVVEGDNHLFMVSAPEGWVLDDTSGMGSRIRCVFYPKGQKWATSPTVMYVNPLHGFSAKERKVSALIADSQKQFLKRSPRGRVTDAGTLPTSVTGKNAIVRYFSEDGGPPHEAVAYVPEKDLVMLIVLSSRTPAGFQKALPAFRELVSFYAWVGTNKEFGR